jgi:hypothetical protein
LSPPRISRAKSRNFSKYCTISPGIPLNRPFQGKGLIQAVQGAMPVILNSVRGTGERRR